MGRLSDGPADRDAEPARGNGPPEPATDWDARITLQEAATISGLSYGYLRQRAADGELRTERMGARLNVTTRRWLDDYLASRARPSGAGRRPKPLPDCYKPPPHPVDPSRVGDITQIESEGPSDDAGSPGGAGE